jgi:hypothetical protein
LERILKVVRIRVDYLYKEILGMIIGNAVV